MSHDFLIKIAGDSMDFYRIKETRKKDTIIIYPDFVVKTSDDLLTKGGNFYAVWDQEKGMWSTDELDVARFIDEDLKKRADELKDLPTFNVEVKWATSYGSKVWDDYKKFVKTMPDSKYVLDMDLTFSNDKPDKKKHASKRLSYSIEEGPAECYEEIISTLYDNTERDKIEWAIGAILSGDAKNIQKFIVFYGSSGTGKSTIMNIILELFQGYYNKSKRTVFFYCPFLVNYIHSHCSYYYSYIIFFLLVCLVLL